MLIVGCVGVAVYIRVKGGEVPGGASLAPKIGPLGMVLALPPACLAAEIYRPRRVKDGRRQSVQIHAVESRSHRGWDGTMLLVRHKLDELLIAPGEIFLRPGRSRCLRSTVP
jgi:hypothetical protein